MNQTRKLPATVSADALLNYRFKGRLRVADLPEIYLDIHQGSGSPDQLYEIVEATYRADLDPESFLLGERLTIFDFAFFDAESEVAEDLRRALVKEKAGNDFVAALGLFDLDYYEDCQQAVTEGYSPSHWLEANSGIAEDLAKRIERVWVLAGDQLIERFQRLTNRYGLPFERLGQAFPYRWWEINGDDYELFGSGTIETLAADLWEARMLDLIRLSGPDERQDWDRLFHTALYQLAKQHLPLADLINEMVQAQP